MQTGLSSEHSVQLEKITQRIALDPRFDMLLGAGSMVQGGFDRWSDLDLVVVARSSEVQASVMSERHAIAQSMCDLLAAFTGEHVGEPRLLICLFGPPLMHVDLKFISPADLSQFVERPCLLWARHPIRAQEMLDSAIIRWPDRDAQWFEDRAWIWLHYGAAKLRRGELLEALGMQAYFREQVLGPMLHRRAGRQQRGVRRIESDAQTRVELQASVAGYDAAQIESSFASAIALYLRLREDDFPGQPVSNMPEALLRYLDN